jgi:DNA ligase-1
MSEIIQKATDWDKQSAAFKKRHGNVDNLRNHWWQPKYDGVHVIIDTTSKRCFSRENKDYLSIGHIAEQLQRACGTGLVFQGEIWVRDTPFKDISGAARRHAAQPHLGVVLYDVHHDYDFRAGRSGCPYMERYANLHDQLAKLSGNPKIIAVQSHPLDSITPPSLIAREYVLRGGYDGIVLRDPDSRWVAGPVREGELIKVKPGDTLDLRVTAVHTEAGEKTGRAVYTVDVTFKGVTTTIGSGMPHKAHEVPKVGQIIEVECMCVNPNFTLREPRFKAIRYDKTTPDA